MGELRIHNVSDDIILAFKDRARRSRTTLQAVLHEALAKEAVRPRLELCEQLQKIRDGIRSTSGEQTDGLAFIREGRENGW